MNVPANTPANAFTSGPWKDAGPGVARRLVGIVIPGGLEHGVLAHETSLLIDVFSPLRDDLLGALR